MTEVYRERHRLRAPAALVAGRITAQVGDPDDAGADGDGLTRWTYRRLWGVYACRVVLDPAAGRVTASVAVPRAYLPAAVGTLLAAVGAAVASLPAVVHLGLLWVAVALALVPVAHRWPGVPADLPAFGGGAEVSSRRLRPAVVPAFLAVVAALWASLLAGSRGSQGAAAAVGALSVVGLAGYAVGGALPWRERGTGLPTVGIGLSALLAPLVAAGNVLVAGRLLAAGPPGVGVALSVAVALAMDVAYLQYCRVALERYAGARIVPLRTRRARLVGLGVHLLANGGLLAGTALGTWLVVARIHPGVSPGPLAGIGEAASTGTPAGGAALPPAGAVMLVVVVLAPVLVVAVGWVYHVLADAAAGVSALLAASPVATPAPIDGAEPAVAVRVADLGAPVLWPVAIPGVARFVVVDRTVYEELAGDELAAALAHEAYHLRGDPALSVIATLGAVAVGGRNALLSFFDYPAVERAADDFAADLVGADPLVRALRRLERLRAGGVAGGTPGLAEMGGDEAPGLPETDSNRAADLHDRTALRRVREELSPSTVAALVVAPYRLLFGSVLLDAAHEDVDRRIARLSGEDGRGDRG